MVQDMEWNRGVREVSQACCSQNHSRSLCCSHNRYYNHSLCRSRSRYYSHSLCRSHNRYYNRNRYYSHSLNEPQAHPGCSAPSQKHSIVS